MPQDKRRFKKRPRGAIPDVIAINFGFGVIARMKAARDGLGGMNDDLAGKIKVQGIFYFLVRERISGPKMRRELSGVNAAIRAGASDDADGFFQDFGKIFFKNFLKGLIFALALPAFVTGPNKPKR